MEKINPKSNQPSYLDQLVDLASHSVVGASAGALASKVLVPLAVQQGAIVGAAVGTATAVVQKALLYVSGQEENTISKGLIAAVSLAGLFFAATHPAAAPLLGRVGLELSKDTILKLCISSFVGEVALGLLKDTLGSTETAEKQVAKLSDEEIKDIFAKFEELTTAKDGKDAQIPAAFIPAFVARFDKQALYVSPKTEKEMTDAPEHVVRFFFANAATKPVEDAAVAKFEERVVALKLPAEQPKDKEAVDKMSDTQVYWAFTHYAAFTTGMDKDAKTALDARIADAKHVAVPAKKEDATAMNVFQLAYALTNYAEFTKGMTEEVKTALNVAIVKIGLVTCTKPADKPAVDALTDLQVRYAHSMHDKSSFFGAKPKYEDVEVITKLNARYAKIDGLAAKTVPTKPTPPKTAEKTQVLWEAYAPQFAQDHPRTVLGLTGTAVSYVIAKGFEAVTGIDIPVI